MANEKLYISASLRQFLSSFIIFEISASGNPLGLSSLLDLKLCFFFFIDQAG